MKCLNIHAYIVLYKASLFPCIYGDHSYSDGWQLWSFNKLPLKSRRKWAPWSPFPRLGVNYELADLHEHSLQLLKKMKKAGDLGNKSVIPWGQEDRDENWLSSFQPSQFDNQDKEAEKNKGYTGNEVVCSAF